LSSSAILFSLRALHLEHSCTICRPFLPELVTAIAYISPLQSLSLSPGTLWSTCSDQRQARQWLRHVFFALGLSSPHFLQLNCSLMVMGFMLEILAEKCYYNRIFLYIHDGR